MLFLKERVRGGTHLHEFHLHGSSFVRVTRPKILNVEYFLFTRHRPIYPSRAKANASNPRSVCCCCCFFLGGGGWLMPCGSGPGKAFQLSHWHKFRWSRDVRAWRGWLTASKRSLSVSCFFSCVQILHPIVEGFGSLQNPVPINPLLTAISFVKQKCLFTVNSTVTVLYGWIKLKNLLNVLFISRNTEYYKEMHRMCKKKKHLKKFAW